MNVGQKLCAALGLKAEETVSLVIFCDPPGDMIEVRAKMTILEGDKFVAVMKTLKLKEGQTEPTFDVICDGLWSKNDSGWELELPGGYRASVLKQTGDLTCDLSLLKKDGTVLAVVPVRRSWEDPSPELLDRWTQVARSMLDRQEGVR